ncbi:hypothetical protein LTR95_002072, partial [Oleoguttula sp. CCFEE 5521]
NPFTTADSLLKYLTEHFGDHNNDAKKSTETENQNMGINEKWTDLYVKYQVLQPYYEMPDEVSEIRCLKGKLKKIYKEKIASGHAYMISSSPQHVLASNT